MSDRILSSRHTSAVLHNLGRVWDMVLQLVQPMKTYRWLLVFDGRVYETVVVDIHAGVYGGMLGVLQGGCLW